MARVVQLLSCQKSTAILIPGSVETQAEGASRGPQEVDVDELVTVRKSVHLGPFQTEIIDHDHSAEGGRSTTKSQTASSRTPCPSSVHVPQEWQQQGVPCGQEHF